MIKGDVATCNVSMLAAVALVACNPTAIDQGAFLSADAGCYEWPVDTEPGAKRVRPAQCSSRLDNPPASRPEPGSGHPQPPPDAGVAPVPDAHVDSPEPDTTIECTEARVRELFARELTAGGCQDSEFGGCHETPNGAPWLLATDLRSELLGKSGECGTPWVGQSLASSLLWQKITSSPEVPPSCGDAMPPRDFGVAMDAAALACVESWLTAVIAARQ